MSKYENNLSSGPILKQIILFSFPLIITGILQVLYNMVDIIVVGQFAGKEALAAVGSTSSLINLATNLFMGISSGACILTARYFGANNYDGVAKTIHTSIALAVISGIIIAVFGVAFAKWMLTLTKSPADIIDQATLYLKIYLGGMPFFMIYNFGSSILRAIGDTKRPLYFLLVSGAINVVLNLVLVIGFNLGVVGVAVATVFAQFISSILVIICLVNMDGACKLHLREIKIHMKEFIEILRNGIPCGISGATFSISNVLIQSSVNSFGSVVVAANTASSNIESIVYIAMSSVSQATLTFVSQNFGANNFKRIKQTYVYCMIFVSILGFALGSISYIFGSTFLKIFSPDPNIIQPGLTRLKCIAILYFLCGAMEVACNTLRGLSYSVLTMITPILGICVFRVIWIFTVFKNYHTLESLFVSYPISWALLVVLYHIFYMFIIKNLEKKYSI